MHTSKLLDVLSNCTLKEIKQFREYVYSPLFNKNHNVCLLIDYIEKVAPDFENRKLDKLQVSKFIFPTNKFEDQKIRDLMSYLTKLLEDFLSYNHFINQNITKELYLLKELRHKGLKKHFLKTEKKVRQLIDKQLKKDSNLYHNKYLLDKELYDFVLQTEEGLEHDMSLQNMIDNLDVYYLFVKLKFSCQLINQKDQYAKKVDLSMIPELSSYLDLNLKKYEDNPSILIYHEILLMNLNNNETNYQQLKDLLIIHENNFTKNEMRIFYAAAQNFCAQQIDSGHTKYWEEIFNLYQFQLKKGILFDEKVFPHAAYNNIVNAGLQANELKSTLKFIEEYKDKIPQTHQESTYTFNLAKYYYFIKDYDKVLTLLQQVNFTDIYYNLGSKAMLARTYYEINEDEALQSLLNAFAIYLKRNKTLSAFRYNNHMQFIKILRKMIQIKIQKSLYKEDEKFEEQLQNVQSLISSSDVINKGWLIREFEKLAD